MVTDKGVRQFRGSRNFPYAERDFAAYEKGSGMSSATLRYLATINRPYQSKRITAERHRNLPEKFEKGVQLQDRSNGLSGLRSKFEPSRGSAFPFCQTTKRSSGRRIEQRFGLLQVERVEAFGKTTVDRSEVIAVGRSMACHQVDICAPPESMLSGCGISDCYGGSRTISTR